MDVVLSLGGSIIVPDKIDIGFVKRFRDLILDYSEKGNKVIIITGGGAVCRQYQEAAKDITLIKDIDLDWIGIKSTKLNAELIRSIFADKAYEHVIDNPTEKIDTDKKIIIGSGWQPGCSSDKDAILIAQNFSINTIINLTNIDYVYDKDPRKFKDAQPKKKLSWDDFLKITGTEWKPGANWPFDPIAALEAKSSGLRVIIAKGTNLENLKNILEEKDFIGTILK